MIIKRKLYSFISIEDLLIPKNKDIANLRRKGYPKFYLDYLSKVNPVICKKPELINSLQFPFAINFENPGDINLDDIKVVNNGKTYISCFITCSKFPARSTVAYLGEDNNFYEMSFKKFEKIKNIKQFLIDEIVSGGVLDEFWDAEAAVEVVSLLEKL